MHLTLLLLLGCPPPATSKPDPEPEPDAPPTWEDATWGQRWHREGYGEAWALAATDLDGDGDDEVLYGGRGLAALDAGSRATHTPRWELPWTKGDEAVLGGDNEWAYAIALTDLNGDGTDDALVLSSENEAYAVDGATGTLLWTRALDAEYLTVRIALFDGDGDGVKDFFPAGGRTAYSGATGEPLWSVDTYLPIVFPLTAELDGQPGDELLLVREIEGGMSGFAHAEADGDDGVAVQAVGGDGTVLWTYSPASNPTEAAAGDLDGDGLDEVILGQDGAVEAGGAAGSVWRETTDGLVLSVAAADLDGDGRDETLLGVQDRNAATRVEERDPDGALVGSATVDGLTRAMQLLPIGGEPVLLVSSGRDDDYPVFGTATAFDLAADAAPVARWSVETDTPALAFATADIGGAEQVLIGGESTRLLAVDAATGAAAWDWTSGGFVQRVVAADLDGDGVDEVVHGDESGFVIATGDDGADRWTRRLDVGGDGFVTGLAAGDVDGDGVVDIVATGVRYFDTEEGSVVERYDDDGSLVFSVRVDDWMAEARLADLDGDGDLEIVVADVILGCGVRAFDGATGEELWATTVGDCVWADIAVGDADGDGAPEIAYGDTHWVLPVHAAMLEADGTQRWEKDLRQADTYWTEIVPGGMVHGGFTPDGQGHVTMRAADDGAEVWSHALGSADDPEYAGETIAGGSLFGAVAEDLTGDGAPEILTGNHATTDARLLDGATGEAIWVTALEAADLPWSQRHEGTAVAWVPGTDVHPPYVVAAEASFNRSRSSIHALDEDGGLLGTIDVDGWATDVTTTSFGAAVGGGLGVTAVEAR